MMKRLLLTFGMAALWTQQAAAESEPILTMFIASPWQRPQDVWPVSLAFVAYDDGLVVKQVAWNDGRPEFVAGQGTLNEVLALAAQTKAHLQSLPADYRVDLGMLDFPTTYLQYWDEEAAKLVEIANYGVPCVADVAEPQGRLTKIMRDAAHPAFVAACDALLSLQLENAHAWYPTVMEVTLYAQRARPDEIVAWPALWPRNWRESEDHKVRKLCAPIEPDATDAATRMPDGSRWIHWARAIAVEETKLAWWVILQKDIAMPGAIYFVDHPDKPLLRGPCSKAVSP